MPFANVNGIRMFYDQKGEGEPLLLIMGITARGEVWEKHLNYWSQYFHCIIADNRGVGLTDAPPGSYSSAEMATDYAGLLEHLDIESCSVIGCSMGSIIAQQLAILFPERVSSLVLMCTWSYCDNKTSSIFELMKIYKERLEPGEFAHYIQQLIYSKKTWDDEKQLITFQQDRKTASSEEVPQSLQGLKGQADACITHNTFDELRSISQPTLVIGGGEDRFVPDWMLREIADEIPHSTLYLYKDAGHAFHWEHIEDFNPRIKKWIIAEK